MTVAWGPFGVTLVTSRKKLLSNETRRSHEVHVGEFAGYDEAVRQALAGLGRETPNEHRVAEIVAPERDGVRALVATVDHPARGGTVHKVEARSRESRRPHDDPGVLGPADD